MIKGRPGPHTFQFLDANRNFFSARIIGEVRDNTCGHISLSYGCVSGLGVARQVCVQIDFRARLAFCVMK